MRYTKSQSEIIGLALIVILVVFGFILAARFMLTDRPDDSKTNFVNKELASNTLNVILRTNTLCKGATVTDLYQDCVTSQRIKCGENNNVPSCDFVNDVVDKILSNTLSQWNRQYLFNVYLGDSLDENNLIFSKGSCPENADIESSIQLIPTEKGNIVARLYICG